MTDAQKRLRELRERQSKERQRMAELSRENELSDEMRSELDRIEAGTPDLERQIRAATTAVESEESEQRTEQREQPDTEQREIQKLRSRVTICDWTAAAVEMRGVDGAAKEYADAHKLGYGEFPLHLLAPVETRATTNADASTDQKTWLDRIFADSMAAYIGVTMESVSPGVAAYPVTTGGAAAAQRGRGEAAADAGWTVGVTELKPTRNSVRAIFSSEDAARLPGIEAALTRDLSKALVEGVDRAVFIGDAGANENSADIAGLSTARGVAETELTQANKVKGDKTLEAFVNLVDGIHAAGLDDLRVVASVGAYRLWASTIHNAAADNQTIAAFMKMAGLSWMARGEIDEATAASDFGAFIGRRRGISGAAVCPVWDRGALIRDPYSGAAKGEIALTLATFWNFGLPRTSNFARLKFVA